MDGCSPDELRGKYFLKIWKYNKVANNNVTSVFRGVQSYEKIVATKNNLYLFYTTAQGLNLARYYIATSTWTREKNFFAANFTSLPAATLLWDDETIVMFHNTLIIYYSIIRKKLAWKYVTSMEGFTIEGTTEVNDRSNNFENDIQTQSTSTNESTSNFASALQLQDSASATLLQASTSVPGTANDFSSSTLSLSDAILALTSEALSLDGTPEPLPSPPPGMSIKWTCLAVDPANQRIYAQCFVPSSLNKVSGSRLTLYCLQHTPTKMWTELKLVTRTNEQLNLAKVMAFWKEKLYLVIEKKLATNPSQMTMLRTFKSSLEMQVIDLESLKMKVIPVQCDPVCQLKSYNHVTWTQVPGTGRLVGAFYHEVIASVAVNELWAIDLDDAAEDGQSFQMKQQQQPQQQLQSNIDLYLPSGSSFGFGSTSDFNMEIMSEDLSLSSTFQAFFNSIDNNAKVLQNEPAALREASARARCLDTGVNLNPPFKKALLCASSNEIWLVPYKLYITDGTVSNANHQQAQQPQAIDYSRPFAYRISFYRIPTSIPRLHELARGAFVAFPPNCMVMPDNNSPYLQDPYQVDLLRMHNILPEIPRDVDLISAHILALYPQYDLRHFRFTDYP